VQRALRQAVANVKHGIDAGIARHADRCQGDAFGTQIFSAGLS